MLGAHRKDYALDRANWLLFQKDSDPAKIELERGERLREG
jgi:hypothetical protein